MFCRLLLITVFCPWSKNSIFGSVLNLAIFIFLGGGAEPLLLSDFTGDFGVADDTI